MTSNSPTADVVDLQQQPDAVVEDDERPPPQRYYRGPYSASTPVITLSPPASTSSITLTNEPEPLHLPGPRSTRSSPTTPSKVPRSRLAASSQTLPLPTPEPRFPRPVRPQQTTITGPPPSQSGDESVQLALVLAFGNDKYSSALSLPLAPTRRPFSTPPTGAHSPPQSPGRHPHSTPSSPPTTPRSPRSPRSPRPDSRPSPPPPLDLRFGSEYADVTSPTSTTSSGTQGSFRTSQASARRSTYNLNSQPLRKPEGTLEIPIPLMLRPRPMWRTTPRSALSSPAYAPAAHLVRRSTFIAAGLELNAPVADMSALGVETRALMFGRDAGVVLPGFDL